jgi:hypothetical protein
VNVVQRCGSRVHAKLHDFAALASYVRLVIEFLWCDTLVPKSSHRAMKQRAMCLFVSFRGAPRTVGIIAVGRGMFVNEDDAKFVPCQRAM